MLKVKAKFTGSKKLLTQRNITFSIKDEIDELELIQLLNTEGILVFNGDELKKEVLEVIKNKKYGLIDENGRTKSEILRGVLYSCWTEGILKKEDAEHAYTVEMDKIINHYKNKLDKHGN